MKPLIYLIPIVVLALLPVSQTAQATLSCSLDSGPSQCISISEGSQFCIISNPEDSGGSYSEVFVPVDITGLEEDPTSLATIRNVSSYYLTFYWQNKYSSGTPQNAGQFSLNPYGTGYLSLGGLNEGEQYCLYYTNLRGYKSGVPEFLIDAGPTLLGCYTAGQNPTFYIPEPSTMFLLGSGLAILLRRRRRQVD